MKVAANVRRKSRISEVERAIVQTEKQMQEVGVLAMADIHEQARELTSGAISTETLRQMGHPFARRRPRLGVPRLPINRQTGALQSSLAVVAKRSARRIRLYLRARFPFAFTLTREGTSRMIPRGFIEELQQRTRGILRKAVLRAFRKK